MKTLPLSSATLQLLSVLFCALFLSGCTTTEQKNDPLYQTNLHVSNAKRTFREAKISGFITAAQREAIDAALKDYDTAYEAAKANPDSANISAAKKAAEEVITRVSGLP